MRDILALIEAVTDPSDDKALSEIDARAWCYLTNRTFVELDFIQGVFFTKPNKGGAKFLSPETRYTISQDAQRKLNIIGPMNRLILVEHYGHCSCAFHPMRHAPEFTCEDIATKTLAELHCRLQALHWERNQ
jgi:hypothetical protein